jgi:hypothetical protein
MEVAVRKPLPKKKIKKAIEEEVKGKNVRDKQYTHEELLSVFKEDVCHNPVKYLALNCPECLFHEPCNYWGKDDYSKRKARPERESVMLTEPSEEKPAKKVKPNNKNQTAPKKKVAEVKVPIPKVKKRLVIPELD